MGSTRYLTSERSERKEADLIHIPRAHVLFSIYISGFVDKKFWIIFFVRRRDVQMMACNTHVQQVTKLNLVLLHTKRAYLITQWTFYSEHSWCF